MHTTHAAHPAFPGSSLGRRGFSLVELLVVVAIIALLVGILIPVLESVRNSAKSTAATAQLTDIANAGASFATDNRRQPGVWSQDDLGSTENHTNSRVSNSQSVLLDLAGGVLGPAGGAAGNAPSTDPTNAGYGVVEIGPRGASAANGALRIDNLKVGSGALGGGYLKLGSDVLQCAPNANRVFTNSNNPDYPGIVDIIDPFGMPVVIFTENTGISSGNGVFATKFSPDPANPNDPRARFYWGSNGLYLGSTGLGSGGLKQSGDPAAPTDLGLSVLSGSLADASIQLSLEGVLGNTAYPQKIPSGANGWGQLTERLVPAAARAPMILISTGPERVYFASKKNPVRPAAGADPVILFAPLRTANDPQSGDVTLNNAAAFGSIIVSGGQ